MGSTTFPCCHRGSYHLQAVTKGFKSAERAAVPVQVTETTSLNIELEVGANTETVTVQGEPQMVQTDSNAPGCASPISAALRDCP